MADYTPRASESGLKICRLCGELKWFKDFHSRKDSKDGLRNECIRCRLARQSAYAKTDAGRDVQVRADQRRNKLFPERRAARSAVWQAVACGRLIPQLCFVCGRQAEAHHADYDAPLDVTWLCSDHHRQAHALVEECRV